jgi:hypothetical protein
MPAIRDRSHARSLRPTPPIQQPVFLTMPGQRVILATWYRPEGFARGGRSYCLVPGAPPLVVPRPASPPVLDDAVHLAYYGVGGNSRRLRWFANQVVRVWRKWLSRRHRGDVVPWGPLQCARAQ